MMVVLIKKKKKMSVLNFFTETQFIEHESTLYKTFIKVKCV